MKRHTLSAFTLAFALAMTGCASSNKQAAPKPEAAAGESRIVGNIPADSKFAKLQLGMSQGEVHEIIGQPTDSFTYSTGKMWIPFYFGNDMSRLEELYKGQGRITFTGSGVGGTNFKAYRIEYDPNESGHPAR
jgi:hypothetical protein